MRRPAVPLIALALSTAAAPAVAQAPSSVDGRARCAQLVAFWQLHSGSKSEGGSGADMVRKRAEIDCEAGRYENGIRSMEDLLRRNGYTVPPAAPSRTN
jgi:hypothetical protein